MYGGTYLPWRTRISVATAAPARDALACQFVGLSSGGSAKNRLRRSGVTRSLSHARQHRSLSTVESGQGLLPYCVYLLPHRQQVPVLVMAFSIMIAWVGNLERVIPARNEPAGCLSGSNLTPRCPTGKDAHFARAACGALPMYSIVPIQQ